MKLREFYNETSEKLKSIENSKLESAWIIENVCGFNKTDLLLKPDEFISETSILKVEEMVKERISGRPLFYILGECEFFGIPFSVGEGVLIPRQETEKLVEEILNVIKNIKSPRILDLCAGSGAISVSIAKKRPDSEVTAVELSQAAFRYLKRNIARNHANNVLAVCADIEKYDVQEKYDLVVSNPPYIPKSDLNGLQKEVKFEPQMALDGGEDGIDFYRLIIDKYTKFAKIGIAFEIGINEEKEINNLFVEKAYKRTQIICDLCRIPRVIIGLKD